MDLWLRRPAVVLHLDDNGVLPCSLPRTGGSLLLMKLGAAAQTGHSDFVVKIGESPEYSFIVTVELSTQLYVALDSHLYV